MSHDQKPGRVRVVGGGGDLQPRRRAGDPPAETVAASPVETPLEDAGGPAPRKSTLLLPMLFVSGCAIGGAAFPLIRAI